MDATNPATDSSGPPSVSLPKGGGAIRGIGEKFSANPVTGTGSLSLPLAISPGRGGFGPQLSLSYDSGAGNGPFGFGWSLSLPAITRKTNKGLPQYRDAEESDVFILSGAEDLVPQLRSDGTRFIDDVSIPDHVIHRYRPRVEGLFARIERWTNKTTGETHWRSFSPENVTTIYGQTDESRIADPEDSNRVFRWLICESFDDKGNAVVYKYVAEDEERVDRTQPHEVNRRVRTTTRYLKSICYGNRVSRLNQPDLAAAEWLFEVILDYDEAHYEPLPPATPDDHQFVLAANSPASAWSVRPDPFSTYRAGFEIRTYRRCHRVLMFHHFNELGNEPYLVRSTEFEYADLDYSQAQDISSELAHPGSTRFASFIRSITQAGFVRDHSRAPLVRNGVTYLTYLKKSLPPIEFDYSKAVIQDSVVELNAASLENLPSGLDANYQWVDLDGEGISGILTEQASAWFYKPGLGDGRFGQLEVVAEKPSLANLRGGRQQLLDLAGDGQLDLALLAGPTPGFYERTTDQRWQSFREFSYRLNLQWDQPDLRFVDLTGDGHADILITEHEVFTWHPSLAEEGFGPAQLLHLPHDEETGPLLVLADGTQSIHLSDMSGDGLSDIVRIRNGEVCYWPNLGYGCFGAKVVMDHAPWFDNADQFDPNRIRLADIDGSGVTDIIYLARDRVDLYFNQSGNRWSDARHLDQFPQTSNLSDISTVDLLGNGTACLVWSSPLPEHTRQPMRYIDLMGGVKPHLLIRSINNLGAETHVHYVSSSKFYLADKLAGKPWITKLPFPVHVVDRVDVHDRISGNRFVKQYDYHHGYFDGVEREFRGFGLVEERDTQEFKAFSESHEFPAGTNVAESSHVPPVLTRTWFHTGVHMGRDHVSNFFAGLVGHDDAGEYYREPGLTDAQARELLLNDTVLPAGFTDEEDREACRALKGLMLRQEIYAEDDSNKQQHPYTVVEQNFTVRRLQPKAGNRHAVFFAHPRESLSYYYERNPSDPRVSHTLTLEVDDFGNVLKTASVSYGRRQSDPAVELRDTLKQSALHVTYTENDFTNSIDFGSDYRVPLPCESRTYEVTGMTPTGGSGRFTFAELVNATAAAIAINYEQQPLPGSLQKRLIEQVRTLYRRNNLAGPLALGDLQSMALPFESYKLSFTSGLVAEVYGGRATGLMMGTEGGYVHSEGDLNWWIASGQIFYSPDETHVAHQELAYARDHFFLPHRYRDPFHTAALSTETFVRYDSYDLLIQETRDALGNRITVGERSVDPTQPLVRSGHDYRVLQAALVMDANRNISTVAFDALGMVVGTALMGKPEDNPQKGDSLAGFGANLTDDVIRNHTLNVDWQTIDSHVILGRATSRIVYDLFAYYNSKALPQPQPVVVYTLVRETHDAENQHPEVQHSFSYSDGFGREIQTKIQAERGPVPVRDPLTDRIVVVNGRPQMTPEAAAFRWVGTGWTVFNNKGKPVRQYEPFFTDTHRFEFDVRIGVSPVLFYDPLERVVATLHPNHTWEKAVFDTWRQEMWDTCDTILIADPKNDAEVGEFFRRLPDPEYLPTWHAERQAGNLGPAEQAAAAGAEIHAGTPAVSYFDSLGRTFLTITHNKFKHTDSPPADPPVEEFNRTRVLFDIEGNERELVDASDRVVMRYDYDMLGNQIHQASMEAGERWTLSDVLNKPLYAWDSRGHQRRTEFDRLRRPTASYLREGSGPELRVEGIVYGETRPNPEINNLREKVVQLFDQAGVVTTDEYDFKGNLLRSERQLAQDYKGILNWSVAIPLETPAYTHRTDYDALNRPVALHTPDTSVIRPTYNKANLLERVEVNLRGATDATPFITNLDYNARGQRKRIEYGNDVISEHDYDDNTFRLVRLTTFRTQGLNGPASQLFNDPAVIQELRYTYDPAGNLTRISDEALSQVVHNNEQVDPVCHYVYDALYRLIEATGREHIDQAAHVPNPQAGNLRDHPFAGASQSGDPQAVRNYTERYFYDAVGNFEQMVHRAVNGNWTRQYAYNETSQLEAGKLNNRLTSTTVGTFTEAYSYTGNAGLHGNITSMTHLPVMQWDHLDQLQATSRQVVNNGTGETTYYVYDSMGQRVRKVTELSAGVIKEERKYLGSFEVYRRHGSDVVVRETLHVMDGKQRIAIVETQTEESGLLNRLRRLFAGPETLIRYQLSNHLGSVSLELNDAAEMISYEEYYPFGSASYQSVPSQTEAAKRYRYTGKERDEESGFYYYGLRYYVPWLGRWSNPDPAQTADGLNLFMAFRDNPITFSDLLGAQSTPVAEQPAPTDKWILKTPVVNVEYVYKFVYDEKGKATARELTDVYGEGSIVRDDEGKIVEGKFEIRKGFILILGGPKGHAAIIAGVEESAMNKEFVTVEDLLVHEVLPDVTPSKDRPHSTRYQSKTIGDASYYPVTDVIQPSNFGSYRFPGDPEFQIPTAQYDFSGSSGDQALNCAEFCKETINLNLLPEKRNEALPQLELGWEPGTLTKHGTSTQLEGPKQELDEPNFLTVALEFYTEGIQVDQVNYVKEMSQRWEEKLGRPLTTEEHVDLINRLLGPD